MADKELICRDCKNPFVFSEGEQSFFAQKGFSDPGRCPTCRQKNRKMQGRDERRSNRY